MTTLTFYFCPGSCSFVSHFALEKSGADFQTRRIALSADEQNSKAYRAVNPRGRVPALVVDGQAITENIAILNYLDGAFPDSRLIPPMAADRTRAYELMSWFASSVQISFSQIWRSERFTGDAAAAATLKLDGRTRVIAAFEEIERLLQPSPWMLGEDFSIVDAYATIFWRWAPRLDIDMTRYPAWNAHAERLLGTPAARRVLDAERRQSAA